jgi:8-oxo-dGTP diphosphatase
LDEVTFLAGYDASRYPRHSLSVDVAVLTVLDGALHGLLFERGSQPQAGRWSLPGGFVGIDESLEGAARRVLVERTGVEGVFVEQLFTFGDPGRDPRTRVVTVAHVALVDARSVVAMAKEAAVLAPLRVPWSGETGGPVEVLSPSGEALSVAFDHADILGMAVKRIRGRLGYTPIGFQLLPESFTLRSLQEVHETVLGRGLNKDSFRRRMLASGQLEATGQRERGSSHRPAELYRFVRRSAV